MNNSADQETRKPLRDEEQQFILHWGEMGSRWGISRAVAQIHALLLISEKPLHAQEIGEALSIARSNVSTGLKELQGWGIISVVHVLGDRRDHFQTEGDAWQMFTTIADKRIERELVPTLSLLEKLSASSQKSNAHFAARTKELHQLLGTGVSFYRRVKSLPIPMIKKLLSFDKIFTKALGL